ncbi:MAG: hypothetical protein AAGF77_06595 [Bacteroidota bacterium]
MFKAIQEKFKVKAGQRSLNEELQKPRSFSNKQGISAVGCIVDMDKFEDAERFQSLRQLLKLTPNAIQIIGYKKDDDKQGMFSIAFCTDKDLGWNGTIENSDFAEFSGRQYDLLINYFLDDRLLLKLMSAKVNARIRVGVKHADSALNDLIFDCGLGDFEIFQKELKKYLEILNEL